MTANTPFDAVEERLAAGWAPSRRQELTWVRGQTDERQGDDTVVEVWGDGTETEPMDEAEEQALIYRTYSDDAATAQALADEEADGG